MTKYPTKYINYTNINFLLRGNYELRNFTINFYKYFLKTMKRKGGI